MKLFSNMVKGCYIWKRLVPVGQESDGPCQETTANSLSQLIGSLQVQHKNSPLS